MFLPYTVKYLHTRPEPTLVEHLEGLQSVGSLPALPANNSDLAYYDSEVITAVKGFIVEALNTCGGEDAQLFMKFDFSSELHSA